MLPSAYFALTANTGVGWAEEKLPKIGSLQEFGTCLDQGYELETCLKGAAVFLKKQPAQRFGAAKLVRVKLNGERALPLFETSLAGKFDKQLCADEDLKLAVIAGLGVPSDYASVPLAKLILGKRCFAELRAAVQKEVEESPDGYTASNACPVFAELGSPCKAASTSKAAPAPAPKAFAKPEAAKLIVEDEAKVFVGGEGRKVTVVTLKGDPTGALVKFEGIKGPWNKKVVFFRLKSHDRGLDFFTEIDGQEYVSIVARKAWGNELSYEVYPLGDNGPYPVGYDDNASKAAKPAEILALFKKSH
jgi:hypothetical protein